MLLKEATIYFYCLFDESRFSDICTIIELNELNWLCKHIKNVRSTNLVFQWIFSVKHKFFHVSIVKKNILEKFHLFKRKNIKTIFNSFLLVYVLTLLLCIISHIYLGANVKGRNARLSCKEDMHRRFIGELVSLIFAGEWTKRWKKKIIVVKFDILL